MSLTCDAKLSWALEACRKNGLRRTRQLEAVLTSLAEREMPTSWLDLSTLKEIQKICDATTVFRIVTKLERYGIARRVGLRSRQSHYVLSMPDGHCDYLICRDCGEIKNLPVGCPIHHLESEIKKDLGFQTSFHELEIYGVCAACSKKH